MGDEKVVVFPGVTGKPTRQVRVERQLELFRRPEEISTFFVFVDIAGFDQESFLEVMATNAVVSLIDIRPAPVFKHPKFNHQEIYQYLSEKNIVYFDYAMAASHRAIFSDFHLARIVGRERNNGLTLCIYDDDSREKGWLEVVRDNFRRSRFFAAELSPRSLTGYTV